jgi:hypothetical protein
MAVLFLLLAFLVVVALAAAGLENTDPSTVTVFNRSLDQLSQGQLLVLVAALGFLVALLLFLAFGASRTRRSRRRELKSRRRDAEGRVDELERENARLNKDLASAHEELEATRRASTDAVAERDRAEATADRIRATTPRTPTDPRVAPVAGSTTGAPAVDDPERPTTVPPEPTSATRQRLDDRTGAPVAREEHAQAADEEARRR